MTTHRVMLADDHSLVRAGIRSLIEELPHHEVVAEAEDGEEAIELAGQQQPDLLVLDINMPRLDGIRALPRIKEASPATRVLIVSMYDSADFVMQALQAGADGYLLKDAAAVELTLALQALEAGQSYLSPAVSAPVVQRALAGMQTCATTPPQPPAASALPLTPRQVDILRRVAAGASMKEIAYELQLSVKTVEAHRAQIMERLSIRNLPQLVLFAVRCGLVTADQP
ncbi:MAG: response regulator transcription factor [Rubrivivax sp.]|nr:MAG: response regulator transcription factor [Rubrivivax sp.]